VSATPTARTIATLRGKENTMGELCRKVVSLFVTLMLIIGIAAISSGCQKKSGPQKAGEKAGESIENAGKDIQKGVDKATK
jgi:hypothetical protein